MAMSVYRDNWAVDTARRRQPRIDPRPPYQRGAVWSDEKKQLLIDTILRNYDIPKIYLRKLTEGNQYDYEVADGQQRLRAIWEFLDNQYPLGESSGDIPSFGSLRGKYYRELPMDAMDRLGGFQLGIAEVRDATDIEIRDLFLRLQQGVTLNPAEKRNAMIGNMRDFIAGMAQHDVFPRTMFRPDRFAWDDLAAHITCLEVAGSPTEVKAENLRRMYEVEQDFDPDGPVARSMKKNLNYLKLVLEREPPEMNIKWGFVDLW